MEVHLTPDVETQLRRLAANRGMDASAIPRGFLSWTVETLNEAVDEWVMALPEDMRARIALLIEQLTGFRQEDREDPAP